MVVVRGLNDSCTDIFMKPYKHLSTPVFSNKKQEIIYASRPGPKLRIIDKLAQNVFWPIFPVKVQES